MNPCTPADLARVARLLRWYPASWRARYGEEFAALLLDDLVEQPRSWRRAVDVAGSGLSARLSVAGLGRGPINDARSTLATLAGAAAAFAGCGLSLWSQLAVNAQQVRPAGPPEVTSLVALSVTIAAVAVLALLAALPVATATVRQLRHDGFRLGGPLTTLAASGTVLVVGGHLAATASWAPTASGPHRGFGALAQLGWAASVGLSTFWVHPHTLVALPRLELGWMALSLAAVGAGLPAAMTVMRRVPLSAAVVAYEARLARLATVSVGPGLLAATWWVLSSAAGPAAVYQAGSLDVLIIGAMAATVAIAIVAGGRIAAGAAPTSA